MNFKICLFLLVAYLSLGSCLKDRVVTIKQGVLNGFEDTSVNGRQFLTFLGIPFAKPPVDELRFMDPEPPENWDGVRDATEFPDYCLQKSFLFELLGRENLYAGREDCLYLNVYTPKIKSKKLLPVMVFIHGGGFYCGGAQEYTGHSLMDRDVVLVVLQYRVGVFGFYSLDDAKFTGNYGMKDQTMAFKWVQENIAKFDGDPESVTIFGESSGGASVQFHTLSPWSEGLFHRAIQQSGSALSPYSFSKGFRNNSLELARTLGCSAEEELENFRNCIQSVDGFELLKQSYTNQILPMVPNFYVPRVDGDFLLDEPATLIKTGIYTKVDLMLGVTQDEAAALLVSDQKSWDFLYKNRMRAYFLDKEENNEELLAIIEDKYFGGKGFSKIPSWEAKAMAEDYLAIYGQQVTADFHSRHDEVKTYLYEFKFKPEYHVFDPKNRLPDNVVDHTTELVFLFAGGGLFNRTLTNDQNIKVQQIMLDMWTNFATFGDPTPDNTSITDWIPVDNGDLSYLEIKVSPKMSLNFKRETMNFWKKLNLYQNEILYPKNKKL